MLSDDGCDEKETQRPADNDRGERHRDYGRVGHKESLVRIPVLSPCDTEVVQISGAFIRQKRTIHKQTWRFIMYNIG